MMHIIQKAMQEAARAHHGQLRKYTGEPYIVHPSSVALMLQTDRIGWGEPAHGPEVIAAALLHDVVEDCAVRLSSISGMFGSRVAALVDGMTSPYAGGNPDKHNRARRKEVERERIVRLGSQREYDGLYHVKAWDLVDNAQSIRAHDQRFWPTFQVEAEALIDAMFWDELGTRNDFRERLGLEPVPDDD